MIAGRSGVARGIAGGQGMSMLETASGASSRMAWTERDVPAQAGRIAVVTGANSGIGLETARVLARKGARVVLAVRDPGRGEAARADVARRDPSVDVTVRTLDLASLESVRAFADGFAAEHDRLDLLINNAGLMTPPFGRTADGFEQQFGVNHLGHFALTGRLSSLLLRTGGARVVTVSSLMHRWGRLDFDNLNAEKHYSPTAAYGCSKLANLLFMRELQRRCPGSLLSTAAHPGVTRTHLQRHSSMARRVVKLPFLAQAAPAGAWPVLYAATAADVAGGDYFGPSGPLEMTGPPAPAFMNRHARDDDAARRLWDVSERLTGVVFAAV